MNIVKGRKQNPDPTFYIKLKDHKSIDYTTFRSLVDERRKMLKQAEENIEESSLFEIENEEKDELSHFVCRLVCSTIEWTSEWFVNTETKLFRTRLKKVKDPMNFFKRMVLPYLNGLKIQNDEIHIKGTTYYDTKTYNNIPDSTDQKIYCYFTKVSDLLNGRRVNLKKGFCLVDEKNIVSLITNEFKFFLLKRVESLRSAIKNQGDDRLTKMCYEIFTDRQNDYTVQKLDNFNIEEINSYSPMCIKQIINHLTVHKHLKYNDRQTLCLYLKGIGVDVDTCIDFFRKSFNVSSVVFDKNYLYNIRHNYGLEGKKANYICFSCTKIAHNTNSVNKSGCPFVDNKETIRNNLNNTNVDIEEIFSENNYNRRCTKLLEMLTRKEYAKNVTTPLKYYYTLKNSKKDPQ